MQHKCTFGKDCRHTAPRYKGYDLVAQRIRRNIGQEKNAAVAEYTKKFDDALDIGKAMNRSDDRLDRKLSAKDFEGADKESSVRIVWIINCSHPRYARHEFLQHLRLFTNDRQFDR